ncbi:MAG: DoxX subfamily [Paludibacter sp. 47-17]|nr:MAG: DoxX subfamily [Paludibacter sp. SCN 50-10]ODU69259.1 MAG: DoxX subfamily [Novosphingobium sp. SCN 66-18]OJX90191.1 MAG: DoxX subfamily [Paludibacter sp. 47-17]
MVYKSNYTTMQLTALVVLRVLTGWYFLYEGLVKLLSPSWSAYGYLMDSKGWLTSFFIGIAESPVMLEVVNYLNIYGLVLIGLSLLLGVFARAGSIGAIVMLALFYLSHPPLMDVSYVLRPEGSYLWVDKNLIILASVLVSGVVFPTSHRVGIDRILQRKKKR